MLKLSNVRKFKAKVYVYLLEVVIKQSSDKAKGESKENHTACMMQGICTCHSVVGNWPHVLLRMRRVAHWKCAVPELPALCVADNNGCNSYGCNMAVHGWRRHEMELL